METESNNFNKAQVVEDIEQRFAGQGTPLSPGYASRVVEEIADGATVFIYIGSLAAKELSRQLKEVQKEGNL